MAPFDPDAGNSRLASSRRGLDRRVDRYRHRRTVRIDAHDVELRRTARADRSLRAGREPPVVELQP